MFKNLNLYTVLTFVIYPVLFTGILLCLFYTCSQKTELNSLEEGKSIVDKKFQENTASYDSAGMADSLYYIGGRTIPVLAW